MTSFPSGGKDMAATRLIAIVILSAATAANGSAAEPPLHPFVYAEGFEGISPQVQLWAHNGECSLNFLGTTDEQAFEGKKSFKLDVVIKSGVCIPGREVRP